MLEGLATRFQVSPGQPLHTPAPQSWWQLLVSPSPPQDTLQMPSESQSALRTLDPSLASLSAR